MSRTLNWPLDQQVHKESLVEATKGKKTHTMWSRKERAYLKRFSKSKSVKQLAKELGKTECAIASQLYLMKKNNKKYSSLNVWTQEEDKFLAENYGTMKSADIGKKLGRTAAAVQLHYSILKNSGKLKELMNVQQLQLNFKEPSKAPAKQVEVAIENEVMEPLLEVKDEPEVKHEKEFNKGQAFLIGLTILNTLILSWILFSSIN